MILFGGSPCYSVCGQASALQQGHQWHWDRIDARARAREEPQDGLHRRPWRVKDASENYMSIYMLLNKTLHVV